MAIFRPSAYLPLRPAMMKSSIHPVPAPPDEVSVCHDRIVIQPCERVGDHGGGERTRHPFASTDLVPRELSSDRVLYRAVCCDLLTALLDSWTLWQSTAGSADAGTRWRQTSLRMVTASGRYRAYEPIVAEAAREVGLDEIVASRLLMRWGTLTPYPDVKPALERLGLPIVILTNTSQVLAEQAAANLGMPLLAVVSAETAGWYKPDRRAYESGWRVAGARDARECLFIAGSPHDAAGATSAGHDVFWVNRRDAALPRDGPGPRWQAKTLASLVQTVVS